MVFFCFLRIGFEEFSEFDENKVFKDFRVSGLMMRLVLDYGF